MRALAFSAFLTLLLLGCDSSSPESGIGDLTLTLNPAGVQGNSLLLQTEREYAENCGLDIDIDGNGRSIQIDVVGPSLTAAVCPAVVGPYTVIIPLPSFGLEGYEVELEKDGETDWYRINRTGDELPLMLMGSGSFSRVLVEE